MFKPIFTLLLALTFVVVSCSSPEIERRIPGEFLSGDNGTPENAFENWISLEDAIQKAGNEDKKILIDVYTDWCGYCKQMERETYTNDRVQSAIDEHFFAVKINAESSEKVNYNGQEISMQDFAMNLGVTGFPTTIFLEDNGEPLGFQPGFIDAETLEKLLLFVGTEAYNDNISFDEFSLD